MAHASYPPSLPDIWVCKLNQFPHRGKKERKKGARFMKVMFVLIVHKIEVPAGSNSGKRIYNHSVKRQHPLLERNRESVTRSWKDSEPALNWGFAIFMFVCVQMSLTVPTVRRCSVLFGDRLFLCCIILQAAIADDRQRVGFCVKDPVLQGEKVIVREEKVQIPEHTGRMLI